MKGVINKGIQDLVETPFGREKWEEICAISGCSELSFSNSIDYPDQDTIDLIMAASQSLQITPEQVMIEFGKSWVSFTAKNSYPTIFAMGGNCSRNFLQNVDRIHKQVNTSIPGSCPPSVHTEDLPDGGLTLHYSSRRNLCPVVHGLILGVGIHFSEEITVEEVQCVKDRHTESYLRSGFHK